MISGYHSPWRKSGLSTKVHGDLDFLSKIGPTLNNRGLRAWCSFKAQVTCPHCKSCRGDREGGHQKSQLCSLFKLLETRSRCFHGLVLQSTGIRCRCLESSLIQMFPGGGAGTKQIHRSTTARKYALGLLDDAIVKKWNPFVARWFGVLQSTISVGFRYWRHPFQTQLRGITISLIWDRILPRE